MFNKNFINYKLIHMEIMSSIYFLLDFNASILNPGTIQLNRFISNSGSCDLLVFSFRVQVCAKEKLNKNSFDTENCISTILYMTNHL